MRSLSWLDAPWRRARRVLGLNARNLLYVQTLNERRNFPLADDKVRTKELFSRAGVPAPRTLAILSTQIEVARARVMLEQAGSFVIKPARGRRGGGVVVITGCGAGTFVTAGGSQVTWDDLRRQMADILFGVHSTGRRDRVLVESRVLAHPELAALAGTGLPDVRVILLRGEPVMAMMRVPTRASSGRANLHQGAAGVALRMSDGLATRCLLKGRPAASHPDTGRPLTGFHVPMWTEVIDVARRAAACLPLPYLGVDVVIAREEGALAMEANLRPGLEIQNVNRRGLRARLTVLERRSVRAGGEEAR